MRTQCNKEKKKKEYLVVKERELISWDNCYVKCLDNMQKKYISLSDHILLFEKNKKNNFIHEL